VFDGASAPDAGGFPAQQVPQQTFPKQFPQQQFASYCLTGIAIDAVGAVVAVMAEVEQTGSWTSKTETRAISSERDKRSRADQGQSRIRYLIVLCLGLT